MGKKINCKIIVSKNGPYLVSGRVPLDKQIIKIGVDGEPAEWGQGKRYSQQQEYALCRCGQSKHKPYCDGTHAKARFNGAKTASKKEYLTQAQKIKGPGMDLTDAEALCSSARFCHRKGGTWRLTEASDNQKLKSIAIQEACDCPSGRLVAWDKKTKKPIELKFKPAISLVEDPQAKASGPIWVKGGVPVESQEGFKYEIRNRITLCRCGQSRNKPFCDGNHIKVKFNDGDISLKGGR
ncbi:MAG: CDGSH iron-sulfur domain-containing protein [Candidatus Omnitrophica bacterium]|nr:CDGSH iron-sulfur domain-containing protein [Candidatus Omnitrophota bacterium]